MGGRFTCAYSLNVPRAYMNYFMQLCWINGTYGYPVDEAFVSNSAESEWRERPIRHYPLIPLMLVVCVGILILPGCFYRSLSKRSGINLEALLKMVTGAEQNYIKADGSTIAERDQVRVALLTMLGRNLQMYRKKTASVSCNFDSKDLGLPEAERH